MPIALKHIRDQLLPGLMQTGTGATKQWDKFFKDATAEVYELAAKTDGDDSLTLEDIHQAEAMIAELKRDKV